MHNELWHAYVFLNQCFAFFRYIPRSEIAGSQVCSIFSLLRSFNVAFHRTCTNLRSHQECMRVLFSLNLSQHLLSLVFLTMVILTGMRGYFIVVLICISLMIYDVEHPIMCLLTICMPSLEKCLFRSSIFQLDDLFFFEVVLYELLIYFGY